MFTRRKTSDIQRLAKQYQSQSTGLTGEYETAYAGYQKNVTEQMAPFEQAMRQYQEVDNPSYERAKSAYEEKLTNFKSELESIGNNSQNKEGPFFKVISGDDRGKYILVAGKTQKQYAPNEVFESYAKGLQDDGTGNFYKITEKKVPTFSEKPPSAPTAPTAPKIDPFNEEPFTKKREELETTYQRELSERKSARLGAARRGSTRPMLQGE